MRIKTAIGGEAIPPNNSLGETGFTLLEALIAIVIASIGLLGLAGLQIISKRGNFEAVQLTQATALANNVIDRMRANSTRLDDYVSVGLSASMTEAEPPSCAANEEDATCLTKIVNYDRWEWQRDLANADALIDPRICITNNAGNVQVIVAWRGFTETTTPAAALNDCGKAAIDNAYLKQIIIDTYITPTNPLI